jgi:transcription antitermination factor NusA-like protein
MSEVGEQEKIDIIVWIENSEEYITNALSPTKVSKVETTELPKQPKLKKKSELESSLLEAIEEHGEGTEEAKNKADNKE